MTNGCAGQLFIILSVNMVNGMWQFAGWQLVTISVFFSDTKTNMEGHNHGPGLILIISSLLKTQKELLAKEKKDT